MRQTALSVACISHTEILAVRQTVHAAVVRTPRTLSLSHANLCLRFFLFFGASAWHRKPPQVYSSVVYTPRHAKTSSHSHPQKQSLGLRHNKALACIPPAINSSWLLLRLMASRAREGCQPGRQTVLFLVLLQKTSPSDTFLVASRKHRPHPRSLQAPPGLARASMS